MSSLIPVGLLAPFIPLFVAASTHAKSSSRLRAGVALAASAVLAVLHGVMEGGGSTVDTVELLKAAGLGFMLQFGSYQAFWKPIVNIGEKVWPDFGAGAPAQPQLPVIEPPAEPAPAPVPVPVAVPLVPPIANAAPPAPVIPLEQFLGVKPAAGLIDGETDPKRLNRSPV